MIRLPLRIALWLAMSVMAWAQSLQVSTNSLSFNFTVGGSEPQPQTVMVTSSGAPLTDLTARPSTNWLPVKLSSATTPATLTVSATASGLKCCVYKGLIEVSSGSNGSSQFVTVSLSITPTISGYVTLSGVGLGGVTMTLNGSYNNGSTTVTNPSGYYYFYEPSGGNYIVTPTKSGYTFSPASCVENDLTSNQTCPTIAAKGAS